MKKSTIYFLWTFCGAFLAWFLYVLASEGGAEVIFFWGFIGVILALVIRASSSQKGE